MEIVGAEKQSTVSVEDTSVDFSTPVAKKKGDSCVETTNGKEDCLGDLSDSSDSEFLEYQCVPERNRKYIRNGVVGWVGLKGNVLLRFAVLFKYKLNKDWYACNVFNGTSRLISECTWVVLKELTAGASICVFLTQKGDRIVRGTVVRNVQIENENTKVGVCLSGEPHAEEKVFEIKDVVLYYEDAAQQGSVDVDLPVAEAELESE